MTFPALIPGTLGSDTRRRVPKVSKNKRVPLWTVEPYGQLFQGIIRVPVSLCNTQQHTNERLRFTKLITDNLARWTEWRRRRGWFLGERPRVSGPFDPPEGDRVKVGQRIAQAEAVIGKSASVGAITEFDYPEEIKWYIAEARFTREEPVYARLEDMLFLRHLALTYGVDPDRDPMPVSDSPETRDVIEVDGGLDPMKVAEERRQALGLKREDYLMGRLEDPL